FPTSRPSDPQQLYIDKIGPDFIRYGQGGLLDTVPVSCPGPRTVSAATGLICSHRSKVLNPVFVAVRVTGDPPHAETLFMDGDRAQAGTVPWAARLVHLDPDEPPCT